MSLLHFFLNMPKCNSSIYVNSYNQCNEVTQKSTLNAYEYIFCLFNFKGILYFLCLLCTHSYHAFCAFGNISLGITMSMVWLFCDISNGTKFPLAISFYFNKACLSW